MRAIIISTKICIAHLYRGDTDGRVMPNDRTAVAIMYRRVVADDDVLPPQILYANVTM